VRDWFEKGKVGLFGGGRHWRKGKSDYAPFRGRGTKIAAKLTGAWPRVDRATSKTASYPFTKPKEKKKKKKIKESGRMPQKFSKASP